MADFTRELDPQTQLSQELLEAKPFPLVVARGIIRLRPQAMKEPMRFLCRIDGHSGAASDVTHETSLHLRTATKQKAKREPNTVGSARTRFRWEPLLQVMSAEPLTRGDAQHASPISWYNPV